MTKIVLRSGASVTEYDYTKLKAGVVAALDQLEDALQTVQATVDAADARLVEATAAQNKAAYVSIELADAKEEIWELKKIIRSLQRAQRQKAKPAARRRKK